MRSTTQLQIGAAATLAAAAFVHQRAWQGQQHYIERGEERNLRHGIPSIPEENHGTDREIH